MSEGKDFIDFILNEVNSNKNKAILNEEKTDILFYNIVNSNNNTLDITNDFVNNPSPAEQKQENSEKDPQINIIDHPLHYTVGGIETIDFIEAKKLNFHLGNVIKYVTRANHKGTPLEDLKKAQWYLSREIETMSSEK